MFYLTVQKQKLVFFLDESKKLDSESFWYICNIYTILSFYIYVYIYIKLYNFVNHCVSCIVSLSRGEVYTYLFFPTKLHIFNLTFDFLS